MVLSDGLWLFDKLGELRAMPGTGTGSLLQYSNWLMVPLERVQKKDHGRCEEAKRILEFQH